MNQRLRKLWDDTEGNEVVTWVVIAALAVVLAAFLFGPNPNSLATALQKIVEYIVSLLQSATT